MNAALVLGRGDKVGRGTLLSNLVKLVSFFTRHVKNDFFKPTHISWA